MHILKSGRRVSPVKYDVSGKTSALFRCLVMLLCFCLFPSLASASETVLDDVKIIPKEDSTIIEIDLGLPLGYVKHFPQTFGEILQIQLLLDKTTDRKIHKEVRQGNDIKPPPGHEPILIYVTYEEGVPGGPYLTLRFSHPVRFEVQAGSSLTTLTVKVFEAKKTAQVTPPLEEARDKRQTPSQVQQKKEEKKEDDELMAKARQALTFGDNTGAIELLRKIIAIPDSRHTQDARELLGLALERSNQIPRAKFEYKKYLKLYKEGEGPNRVQQRLTALQNIGVERREKLRPTRRSTDQDRFKTFGRWSQAYSSRFLQRTPINDDDKVGSEDLVLTRLVTSNLNIRGRYRGETSNLQAVLTTNHTFDDGDHVSSSGTIVENDTESRVSEFYLDYDEFKRGYSATLGRQRTRNNGVFGRFDGIVGGYQFTEDLKVFAIAGQPVSFFNIDFDKNFYGVSLEYGKKKAPLNSNLYYVTQDVDGIGDREALGGGVRYADKEMTLFGLLDYDLLFGELTLANIRWGWKFSENTKINLSYNYRNLLFTSTAINGQKILSIEGLHNAGLSDDVLRDMAVARTSDSSTTTLGYSFQFDKDTQFNADLSIFSSSGTQAYTFTQEQIDAANAAYPEYVSRDTGGAIIENSIRDIEALADTGNQYSYSFQYIASNMFAERDLHVAGLRYSDFSSYKEVSLFLNSRLPPIAGWKPRPRLNLSQRSFGGTSSTTGTRNSIAPSIIVDYGYKKQWVFDFELGFEWVDYSDPNFNDETRQNIRIGYNYTF